VIPIVQPGDVARAFDAMDNRAKATAAARSEHIHDAGTVNFDPVTRHFSGGAVEIYRLVYGDLFSFEELFEEGGAALIRHALAATDEPEEDLASVLLSLLAQSVAVGCLMERARWMR
jgi:hypothetical protein